MKVKPGDKQKKESMTSSSSEEVEETGRKSMGEGVSKPKASPGAFTTYIYRVKKQVHPDLGITKSSMKIIESFITDFFERICRDSSNLMMSSGNKSLRSQDVLAAIKMVLPGELGKHAYNEAEKAIKSFVEAV